MPPKRRSNWRQPTIFDNEPSGRRTTRAARSAGGQQSSKSSQYQTKDGVTINVSRSKERLQGWVEVWRQPSPGVNFQIPIWVRMDQLTEEEKDDLAKPEDSSAEQQTNDTNAKGNDSSNNNAEPMEIDMEENKPTDENKNGPTNATVSSMNVTPAAEGTPDTLQTTNTANIAGKDGATNAKDAMKQEQQPSSSAAAVTTEQEKEEIQQTTTIPGTEGEAGATDTAPREDDKDENVPNQTLNEEASPATNVSASLAQGEQETVTKTEQQQETSNLAELGLGKAGEGTPQASSEAADPASVQQNAAKPAPAVSGEPEEPPAKRLKLDDTETPTDA